MDEQEIKELAKDSRQRSSMSTEAEAKRRKLEENLRREEEARKKRRAQLLKREQEVEEVREDTVALNESVGIFSLSYLNNRPVQIS